MELKEIHNQLNQLDKKVQSILDAIGGNIETGVVGISTQLREFQEDLETHQRQDDVQFSEVKAERNKIRGAVWAVGVIWIAVTVIMGLLIAVK